MASALAVLRLALLLSKRDFRMLTSVGFNNFFLVILVLVAGSDLRHAFYTTLLFQLVLLLPLLFSMAAEAMDRVPADRESLLPLGRAERLLLHLSRLLLQPLIWICVLGLAVLFGPRLAALFALLAAAVQMLVSTAKLFAARSHVVLPTGMAPQALGALGGLAQIELRAILSTLDFYAALLLSLAGSSYRFFAPRPESEAFPILAVLIAVAISTFAQCSFSLYADGGVDRLRLLPMPSWALLLVKDGVYLGVVALLTSPLSLFAGLAFSMMALAVGRYPSICKTVQQQRWRFLAGDVRFGMLQLACGTGAALAAVRLSQWSLLVIALLYAASVIAGDRWWKLHRSARDR